MLKSALLAAVFVLVLATGALAEEESIWEPVRSLIDYLPDGLEGDVELEEAPLPLGWGVIDVGVQARPPYWVECSSVWACMAGCANPFNCWYECCMLAGGGCPPCSY